MICLDVNFKKEKAMKTKNIGIPIELLIDLLKKLNDDAKEEIFEKVFIKEDTIPLTKGEKIAIKEAESELKAGETTKWPFGK